MRAIGLTLQFFQVFIQKVQEGTAVALDHCFFPRIGWRDRIKFEKETYLEQKPEFPVSIFKFAP